MILLFLMTYYQAARVIRARSIRRMEEGVNTVVEEVVSKLNRDSRLLNAAVTIITNADVFDENAFLETMNTISPLLETMNICVLLPDNRVLQPEGSIIDGAGHLDFATEAALGEHVSNRVTSISDEGVYVLRHFVPLIKNGQVAALLYGRTILEDLPGIMNIDNIYNASADVYIIDAETGEFLMDTRHDGLGALDDFVVQEVRGGSSWEDAKQDILNLKDGYIVFKGSNAWHNFYYTPAARRHQSMGNRGLGAGERGAGQHV